MEIPKWIGDAAQLGGSVAGFISPWAEAIGAASSLFGGLFGGDSSKKQKELAKYNAELEHEMWLRRFNLQNEYNSPSAMRERLRAAGMNENLAYGSLSPNMAANPHTNSVNGQISKYQTGVEKALSMAQIAEINNNNKLKRQEISESKAREKEAASAAHHHDMSAVKELSEANKNDAETYWKRLDNILYEEYVNMDRGTNTKAGSYNKYIEADENSRTDRAYKAAIHDLKRDELNFAEKKWDDEQQIMRMEIRVRMYDAITNRIVGEARAEQLNALTDVLIEEKELKKVTTDGIILDNGLKEVNLSWSNLEHAVGILERYEKAKLTRQQAKTELIKRLNISAQTADLIIRRGQSLFKQFKTRGLTF